MVHDLSKRYWSHNCEIMRILPENRLSLVVWNSKRIEAGDYLILANGTATTRYQAEQVEYPGDPPDQCFVTAVFAPRPEGHEE